MADLPFLKKKFSRAGVGPFEVTHSQIEGSSADDLVDEVAGEFISAIERKDIKAFRQALHALILIIKQGDMDGNTMHG
jgi:hypothetical protein